MAKISVCVHICVLPAFYGLFSPARNMSFFFQPIYRTQSSWSSLSPPSPERFLSRRRLVCVKSSRRLWCWRWWGPRMKVHVCLGRWVLWYQYNHLHLVFCLMVLTEMSFQTPWALVAGTVLPFLYVSFVLSVFRISFSMCILCTLCLPHILFSICILCSLCLQYLVFYVYTLYSLSSPYLVFYVYPLFSLSSLSHLPSNFSVVIRWSKPSPLIPWSLKTACLYIVQIKNVVCPFSSITSMFFILAYHGAAYKITPVLVLSREKYKKNIVQVSTTQTSVFLLLDTSRIGFSFAADVALSKKSIKSIILIMCYFFCLIIFFFHFCTGRLEKRLPFRTYNYDDYKSWDKDTGAVITISLSPNYGHCFFFFCCFLQCIN